MRVLVLMDTLQAAIVLAKFAIFPQEVQKKLKEQGIPTAVHYPIPLNKQPAFAHLKTVV